VLANVDAMSINDTCTCHADVVAVQKDFGEFGGCAGVVAVVCMSALMSRLLGWRSGVLFGDVFEHHVWEVVSI